MSVIERILREQEVADLQCLLKACVAFLIDRPDKPNAVFGIDNYIVGVRKETGRCRSSSDGLGDDESMRFDDRCLCFVVLLDLLATRGLRFLIPVQEMLLSEGAPAKRGLLLCERDRIDSRKLACDTALADRHPAVGCLKRDLGCLAQSSGAFRATLRIA
jgi:hypothetical protein